MATLYGENIAADFDDKLGNCVWDSLCSLSVGFVTNQPANRVFLLGAADNMGGIRTCTHLGRQRAYEGGGGYS